MFENEKELSDLLVAAGFPSDSVAVRREGRGCAIIKAAKASSAGPINQDSTLPEGTANNDSSSNVNGSGSISNNDDSILSK